MRKVHCKHWGGSGGRRLDSHDQARGRQRRSTSIPSIHTSLLACMHICVFLFFVVCVSECLPEDRRCPEAQMLWCQPTAHIACLAHVCKPSCVLWLLTRTWPLYRDARRSRCVYVCMCVCVYVCSVCWLLSDMCVFNFVRSNVIWRELHNLGDSYHHRASCFALRL